MSMQHSGWPALKRQYHYHPSKMLLIRKHDKQMKKLCMYSSEGITMPCSGDVQLKYTQYSYEITNDDDANLLRSPVQTYNSQSDICEGLRTARRA